MVEFLNNAPEYRPTREFIESTERPSSDSIDEDGMGKNRHRLKGVRRTGSVPILTSRRENYMIWQNLQCNKDM